MRAKAFFFIFALAASILPLTIHAYSSPGKPAGYVNDFAGLLNVDQRAALETKLQNYNKTTTNQVVVATIPTLNGDTVENFAVKLFEEWGVGQKGKDNGVLLLIAAKEKQLRIEVGYGLEGALTDAQSYWIIRDVITPAFKQYDYSKGINEGVDKIIAATKGENLPTVNQEKSNQSFSADSGIFQLGFFFIIFILSILRSILGRTKSWWLGGVLGGAGGVIIGLIFGFLYAGIVSIVFLSLFGLLFDYLVSKNYDKWKNRPPGGPTFWGGGFGGGGGGGFGGFGGGRSGGGGSSGSW